MMIKNPYKILILALCITFSFAAQPQTVNAKETDTTKPKKAKSTKTNKNKPSNPSATNSADTSQQNANVTLQSTTTQGVKTIGEDDGNSDKSKD